MSMNLRRALFETGLSVKDGNVNDLGRTMSEERLQEMSARSKQQLHDLYLSSGTTVEVNSAVRFDEALDIILKFTSLAPARNELELMGVSVTV